MIIKTLLEPNKKSIWIALGWTFLILFLSFKKASSLQTNFDFPNLDKVVHFMFYFVFVFLWYRFVFSLGKQSVKILFFISFVAIILGIAIEYLQGIVTVDRNSDLYDVLANSLGVLTGAFFSYLFLNKKQ